MSAPTSENESDAETGERAAFEAWEFFDKMNDAAKEYAWRGWKARAQLRMNEESPD